MEYKCNDEDINLLLKQIIISKNDAKSLLKKHNGDITKCILDNYEFIEPKKDITFEDKTSQKLYELRKILDEKDALFNQIINKNKK